jgi:hypothetical protein
MYHLSFKFPKCQWSDLVELARTRQGYLIVNFVFKPPFNIQNMVDYEEKAPYPNWVTHVVTGEDVSDLFTRRPDPVVF